MHFLLATAEEDGDKRSERREEMKGGQREKALSINAECELHFQEQTAALEELFKGCGDQLSWLLSRKQNLILMFPI